MESDTIYPSPPTCPACSEATAALAPQGHPHGAGPPRGWTFPARWTCWSRVTRASTPINLDMREVDRPTDVLSFPEFELTPGQLPGAEDADPGTGLCPAGGYGHLHGAGEGAGEGVRALQPRGSSAYLAVHSVLHLLGYDHMDEGAAEGADARARGGHHVPAGTGEIVKIAQMKES